MWTDESVAYFSSGGFFIIFHWCTVSKLVVDVSILILEERMLGQTIFSWDFIVMESQIFDFAWEDAVKIQYSQYLFQVPFSRHSVSAY